MAETPQNFVRVAISPSIDDTATLIRFNPAQPPWKNPVDPGGEKAYALLVDRLRDPTKFEIVSFTKVEFNRLKNVTRGVNGTTAQSFTGGAYITQDLPQALVEPLGIEGSAGDVLQFQDVDLALDTVDWPQLAKKPVLEDQTILSEIAAPASPATDTARLFLNSSDGKLTVQFDSGTTDVFPP